MTDAEIISQLGGSTKLAGRLGVKQSRVGNWSSRGIPPKYRIKIAKLVDETVTLPEDFLDPAEAA